MITLARLGGNGKQPSSVKVRVRARARVRVRVRVRVSGRTEQYAGAKFHPSPDGNCERIAIFPFSLPMKTLLSVWRKGSDKP
jgi:hypothetical protein